MTTENSTEERIRKIFVKDLKSNEVVHTVFKAHTKTASKARSGKPYLALLLIDKTGQVDGRVFDNVDAASAAFAAGDYLLVKGKVGQFHGKAQLVIERLERLDPEPIDAADFAFVPVVEAPRAEVAAAAPARKADEKRDPSHKATRARLLKLLDVPEVLQAFEVILKHLESTPETAAGPSRRAARGPRVEHKHQPTEHGRTERHEPAGPKRDASLPEGIAFKPFEALVPAGNSADDKSQG